jgi:hypothetical protein
MSAGEITGAFSSMTAKTAYPKLILRLNFGCGLCSREITSSNAASSTSTAAAGIGLSGHDAEICNTAYSNSKQTQLNYDEL